MKKYILFIILILSILVLSGFTSKERTDSYQNLGIEIQINKDGYYSLMSQANVHYSNNQIDYITLNEPSLMSFAVSSKYEKAIWLLNKSEGENLIKQLTEIKDSLTKQGNKEMVKKIENMISYLKSIGPISGEST